MLKQKLKIRANSRPLLGVIVIASVLIAATAYSTLVRADQFDTQIKVLQEQNAANRQIANQLAAQASSYQDAINKLESQINSLQQAIVANQRESDSLQRQIEEQEKELAHQKKVLGQNIKVMYLEGEISTLEMLASSRDLSDFVDKAQYRSAVRDKIKTTVDKINQLKLELQAKKTQIEELIKAQQAEREQVAAAEAEQSRLLAYTEGQKAAYNSQIRSNQAKIADLRRQQAIANARYNIGDFRGDPNHGGYPNVWANAPQDSMIDTWGMYNRECVSYAAFKVHQDFMAGRNNRDMPYWGGHGNANQWDNNARVAGIPVDFNPTPGSIAISNAGFWGHAMYVEAVDGDRIYISQYNAQLNGQYSEGWRYATGLVFLHF